MHGDESLKSCFNFVENSLKTENWLDVNWCDFSLEVKILK